MIGGRMSANENSYVWEQLFGAVLSLSTSELNIKSRIQNAVESRVCRLFFSEKANASLPPIVREKLLDLEKKLTQSGSFEQSIDKMDDSEVENIIEEIVSAFSDSASYCTLH